MKNKFDIELNLFEHFQYYFYIREKLIKKNYNFNEEKWAKDYFLVTKNKSIHLDFKFFVNNVLSTNIKNKQSNNHFFLRTLLAEKNEKYIRISYSNLYKKLDNLSLEDIKIGDKNIGAKNIYSNKILTNETENVLNVNFLETNYREFIRKQDTERLNPKIILDTQGNDLYLDITKQTNFIKNIQDYIALQVVRNESLFLNLIDLFNPHIKIKHFTLFDYLFF